VNERLQSSLQVIGRGSLLEKETLRGSAHASQDGAVALSPEGWSRAADAWIARLLRAKKEPFQAAHQQMGTKAMSASMSVRPPSLWMRTFICSGVKEFE
jgi:hypothetical protein